MNAAHQRRIHSKEPLNRYFQKQETSLKNIFFKPGFVPFRILSEIFDQSKNVTIPTQRKVWA